MFWIFAVTAGLAFYAGIVAGVRVQLLLGFDRRDRLLDGTLGQDPLRRHQRPLGHLSRAARASSPSACSRGPSTLANQPRWRRGRRERHALPSGDLGLWKASELLTGAGIAAVIAMRAGHRLHRQPNPLGAGNAAPIQTSNLWDILLLLVSLGLVAIGSQIGTRGPVYVGAIGLLLFLVIAGLRSQLDPAAPVQVRGLAVGPAGARPDRYRRSASRARRASATSRGASSRTCAAGECEVMGGCSYGATRLMSGGTRFDE